MHNLPSRRDTGPLTIVCLILMVLTLALLPACATTYRQYETDLNPDAGAGERHLAEGNYELALESYRKAQQSYEAEKNEQGALFCLERMGWIQREIGHYGEALELFRRAYPIGERLNGDAAEIDADLGDVYLFSGDSARAQEHYLRTLTTLKDFVFKTSYAGPPSSREITTMVRKSKAIIHARTNLGTLHYFGREYEKALEHLNKADELIQRVRTVAGHSLYGMFFKLDSDFLEGVGFCQTMMGATYGEMGQLEKAWPHFDAGRDAFEKGEKPYGLIINEALRYKIEFLSPQYKPEPSKFQSYEQFLERAERYGALDVVWRMAYEIGRALARERLYPEARKYLARAIEALEQTRSRLREDTVKKMFAASVQDVYAEMIRLLFEMKLYEEGFDYLERSRARAFLDMLAGRSLQAKKSVEPLLLQKEKKIEQEMEVLTRKLRTSKGSERNALYETYRGRVKERTQVLEAIKTQSLEFAATTTVTTVSARKIAERIEKGTALISYFLDAKRCYIWVISRGEVTAIAADIGAKELGDLISDYRHAIATQQGSMTAEVGERLSSLLIRPVLAGAPGTDHLYIVPSMGLHYLPFSSLPLPDGRFLIQQCAISILPNASSLFFLDKQIALDRNTLLAIGNPEREGREPPLKFAEEEVKVIARDFPSSTVRTGKEAAESLIKERDWTGTGIIHIAAHGRFNSSEPLKSALLLARDGRNDGDLETFEIFSLAMNPRLVVLSACESGLGKLEGGDEVQGLNRAFLYAGAGGVVSSLWNVSDQSTYRLMEHFYTLLHDRPAADALREAQVRLMKEYPLPFYWAPFYLTGGMGL